MNEKAPSEQGAFSPDSAGPLPDPPAPDGLGTVLEGRYRLDALVGEGGMARVYRAEDLSLGRTVALKLMRAPTDSGQTTDRVRAETAMLAALAHPSLVTLYDAHITADGPSFLVMEYVDGPTLRERLIAAPITREELAAIAVDVAEALHVVHAAGIVHRDIKPSNVLLWPSPVPDRGLRAKLADFGIAYLLDSTHVTTPGTVIGTAAYLAPEQLRGEAPTPAADIYSLGLVLLEAVTGERAFAHAVGHEALVVRLTVSPTIPEDLPDAWRTLLTAMTAANPPRRPDALEVMVAAASLAAGAPHATADPVDADATAVVAARAPDGDATSAPADAPAPEEDLDRTRVLAPAGVDEDAAPGAGRARTRPRRRTVAIVATVIAVIAAVAIVGGILASGLTSREAQPTLPVVDDPLGTHLQELLDEVTP